MNLPNKLTVTRLVLAPVFFIVFFLPDIFPSMNAILYAVLLVLVYGVMELTDLLDGKIARKNNLVTDLGKVLDPFADVISHLTFFTCLLACGVMPVWAFIPIVWREFAQSFTRMLMMGKGKAMAANIFGKAKTCLYALSCPFGFAMRIAMVKQATGTVVDFLRYSTVVLFALAAVASVVSYLIYVNAIRKSGVLSDMTR
ncbi:MAG: CDP-diacylglycerol--glycerol-3-phosphate 3-phosphatidyltransferase [Spirochaetales bacterium]|nr:CDP-diacylglycerol--glycerol-3-phosphate 3-phosphatidyltransferase [Spirochaetales bacterium]